MGLLSKLKAAKNYMTGGGAEVRVRPLSDPARGEAMELQVGCKVKDAPMEVSRVYVKFRAIERIRFTDYDHGEREHERKDATTFKGEVDIAGPQTLEAGQGYSWTGTFSIPADAKPTYNGVHCNHEWEMCAYLDKKGNDPDSGWKTFHIS